MRVVVDGVDVEALVDAATIDAIIEITIAPLFSSPSSQREYVFLVAPPGAGKSTLAAVLEKECTRRGLDIQSIGLDGFHRTNAELGAIPFLRHGVTGSLRDIKGAPETFDVDALLDHVERARHEDIRWPVYDRTDHEPHAEAKLITAPVVLLEGNWLLLDEPAWSPLSPYASRSALIDAHPEDLRDRLVERKVRGGSDRPSAEAFVTASDLPNIERVLTGTDRQRVDLVLHLGTDGTTRIGALR